MFNTFKKISLLIPVCLGIIYSAKAQQQFTFAQYMNNLTPINNAYSVTDDATRISLSGRKQLAGIDGAPTSFLFYGSTPIQNIGASAGLVVLNDKLGVENLTDINAFFAKKIQLSNTTFLSTSVNAGFNSHKINYSELNSPNDPQFNGADFNETSPEVGLAIMLYGSNYYLGISAPRLPVKKDVNDLRTYYATGALLFPLGTEFSVKPAALLSYVGTNTPTTLDGSVTLYIKKLIGVGGNYNTNRAFSGILSLNVNNNFQFGYSYGFNTGSLAVGGINNATQEVSLSYRFGKALSALKLL